MGCGERLATESIVILAVVVLTDAISFATDLTRDDSELGETRTLIVSVNGDATVLITLT